VKPFVLRFWESEFPALKAKKTETDGLAYSRADVEMILAIKQLLYDKGLTLAEARNQLCGAGDEAATEAAASGGLETKKSRKKKPKAAAKPVPPVRKGKTSAAKGVEKSAPPKAVKAVGRRGLPVAGSNRSSVSFEDLLPNPTGSDPVEAPQRSAGKKRASAEKKPLSKTVGGVSSGTVAIAADPDHRVLQEKLCATLNKLREILTFLDRDDR
jgi:DNA-binding transcriptional MerR regulator